MQGYMINTIQATISVCLSQETDKTKQDEAFNNIVEISKETDAY